MTGENSPELSVVVPVFNERDNVAPLVGEIVTALRGRIPFEIVYVDDCSKDDSFAVLKSLMAATPELRVLRHTAQSGQSTAIRSGVKAARGAWIATLDGDGQNDPADLPAMLEQAQTARVDCVTGVRKDRHDTWLRRFSSRVANGFRNWITGDAISDSGCGIRVVRRAALAEVPVFNGMHRFLPTLLRGQGFAVAERVVGHRERTRGVSKYGVHNRLWRGIRDCFGIRWYLKRAVRGDRLRASVQ
jgi:dolichol-phosphate mannosyltransferase